MISSGLIEFDEARRGADAWLKAWRKRNADFSLSNLDYQPKESNNIDYSLSLIDKLDVHLTPSQWIVLKSVITGTKAKQMASVLNIPERSIWTQRQRIKKVLRKKLDN